jgi:alpha-L-rhamnosidase
MQTKAVVLHNGKARVVLNGIDEIVTSGGYSFETEWKSDAEWPPKHIQGPQGLVVTPNFIM